MYEKPQYLTPDGYRRTHKRPGVKKTAAKASVGADAGSLASARRALQKSPGKIRSISPEAAKIIAQALKGMLRQK